MKTLMKNSLKYLPLLLAVLFIGSCDNDDVVPEFTLQEPSDKVAFTSTFSDEYLLSMETASNIAERLVWSPVSFGVPTEISYQVQWSTTGNFDEDREDFVSGTLSETNFAVSVGTLMQIAKNDLGLDEDPGTEAGNTGTIHFRIRAFAGTGEGQTTTSSLSDPVALNITLIETAEEGEPVPNCPSIWVVGAGAVDAGWNWDSPIEFTCVDDVFSTNINLTNDTFRFFLTEGDWTSGQNYPYYIGEGYTIDANFEDALDGDNNFRFLGTPGTYRLTVDTVNKTIVLSEATGETGTGEEEEEEEAPSAMLYVVGSFLNASGYGDDWTPANAVPIAASSETGTDYEGFVNIDVDGAQYKFLPTNESFDGDYGDTGDTDGSYNAMIEQDDEVNCGTPDGTGGYYLVRADTEALTYSLEKTSWAVTGNATPLSWPAGPDGTAGQDHDMVYDPASKTWSITIDLVAQEAPDNGLKFRANDAWSLNLGDTDADGSLQFNGTNITIPEDGNYTVTLDLSNPRAYTYSLVKN